MLASNTKLRPVVAFDVTNKLHRKYYNEFVEKRTWGRCPVRFAIEDESTDLIAYINRKMVDFYLAKEFGKMSG